MDFGSKENLALSNPYLKNEENYNRTRQNIQKVKIIFEEKSIFELGAGKEKYNLMLFSNIESYAVRDVVHSMSEEYMDCAYLCEQGRGRRR